MARPELHANVLTALGQRITSGQLPAGTVITLEGVGSDYSVSRSVAREAIRVLESMGLVSSRRRVGITVLAQEHWNVFDPRVIRWRLDGDDRPNQLMSLSELRQGFEPAAAALAAKRATVEECGTLARAVSDMVVFGSAGDLESYLRADTEFHRTLLVASGNEMFRALADVVVEVLHGRTHHGLMPDSPNPDAIALHDDVARAIRNREPETAERAMRAIIVEAATAIRSESTA